MVSNFSYLRWKPRNVQLAKMDSYHQSKRSDNKWYAVEVRSDIFIKNLTFFSFLRAVVNIPIQTLLIPPWLLLSRWPSYSWSLGHLWFKWRVSSQRVDEITTIANVQFVSEARGFLKGLKTLRKRRYVFKPSAGNIKIVKRLYNFEF